MAPQASPFRVLLVDDEPVIRELVQAMLEGGGVVVRCMDSGAAALRDAAHDRPDLVLLDIVMPGLDGLAVLRILRADATMAGVPIHMLTARAKPSDRAAALKAGADGYIEKPFKGQALQALVASLRRRPAR